MPIYEYKCMKCSTEFEYLVFGGDHSVCCPECTDEKVERLMSACNFKSSGGSASSAGSSGCSSCTSKNCSNCH